MSKVIANLEFQFVCAIEPERDADGRIREEHPELRFDNPRNLPLNPYGRGPFCRFRIPSTWAGQPGVYVLTLDGLPVYAGKCDDLAVRFNTGYGQISPRNCYQGGQETNCRINAEILRAAQAGARLELFFHATPEAAETEAVLIRRLQPPWNRQSPNPAPRPSLVPLDPSVDSRGARPRQDDHVITASNSQFEDFWRTLTAGLRARTLIRNWTADKGYLGNGDFTAQSSGEYILCEVPGAGHLQRVPKRDFKFLFDRWEGYLRGTVPRSKLRDESRFTKYTLSILNHFLGGGRRIS